MILLSFNFFSWHKSEFHTRYVLENRMEKRHLWEMGPYMGTTWNYALRILFIVPCILFVALVLYCEIL
jgi:hypothetical protein